MSDSPGARLRQSVNDTFACDPVTAELLNLACSTLDVCEALSDAVALEGALVGGRPNPSLVELRQQRLLLSKLLGQLKLPADAELLMGIM